MPTIETVPGIQDLWAQTLGNPCICVAVLDGAVDLSHPCFQGAKLSQLSGYGQQTPASEDYATHATHVTSVIFGQHDSEVKGIAPQCRGVNIAIAFDKESVLDPLSLVRGIDLALENEPNILHIASCIPTCTGRADDFLERAIRTCIDNNILVVAPAGNDNGERWCLPAALPDVLTVGALTDKGVPFKFSNWGGIYQKQGIVAPGENILGAEPGGVIKRRKGTSCSAPIVTGVAALLMSLQDQNGEEIDSHAIRDAILKSALACDAEDFAEPSRCLVGKLNVPGAVRLLFDPRYARYRQSSATRSRRTSARTGIFGQLSWKQR